MAALVKACDVSSIQNTGVECSAAMGPAAMFLIMPPGLKWTNSDLSDFPAYVEQKMHASAETRIYPLFGNSAPIRSIEANDSDDTIQTFDDGVEKFIRSGYANRIYRTEKGGLCLAASMRSLLNIGYAFVEIDKEGNICFKKNSDGTYSGFPSTGMGGVTPKAATFTESYMNGFRLSYDVSTYINSGLIMKGAESILDFMGLIDTNVTAFTASTTTRLKIGVKTQCAGTDLVALLGVTLAVAGNFVVTNASTGAAVSITGASIVSGNIELAGTFTTATTYRVALAPSATLYTNGVEGYEGVKYKDILIP